MVMTQQESEMKRIVEVLATLEVKSGYRWSFRERIIAVGLWRKEKMKHQSSLS